MTRALPSERYIVKEACEGLFVAGAFCENRKYKNRHAGEGRYPVVLMALWIPAFAGMTEIKLTE